MRWQGGASQRFDGGALTGRFPYAIVCRRFLAGRNTAHFAEPGMGSSFLAPELDASPPGGARAAARSTAQERLPGSLIRGIGDPVIGPAEPDGALELSRKKSTVAVTE